GEIPDTVAQREHQRGDETNRRTQARRATEFGENEGRDDDVENDREQQVLALWRRGHGAEDRRQRTEDRRRRTEDGGRRAGDGRQKSGLSSTQRSRRARRTSSFSIGPAASLLKESPFPSSVLPSSVFRPMILLGVNIDHCATVRQARYRQADRT